MKRNYMFGTLLAVALSVSVGAQTQTPTQGSGSQGTAGTQGTGSGQIQQPVPGTQGSAPPAATPLTLTGCLTPLTASAGAGTTGGYTLGDISGAASGSPSSYTLIGGDPNILKSYGNSRVEIVGSTQPMTPATASTAPGSPATAIGTSGTGVPPAMGTVTPSSPTGSVVAGSGSGTSGGAGTVTVAPASGAGATAGAAGSGAASAGGIATPPNFNVISVRQVPGNCGGQ
jgi:hypothetical protein